MIFIDDEVAVTTSDSESQPEAVLSVEVREPVGNGMAFVCKDNRVSIDCLADDSESRALCNFFTRGLMDEPSDCLALAPSLDVEAARLSTRDTRGRLTAPILAWSALVRARMSLTSLNPRDSRSRSTISGWTGREIHGLLLRVSPSLSMVDGLRMRPRKRLFVVVEADALVGAMEGVYAAASRGVEGSTMDGLDSEASEYVEAELSSEITGECENKHVAEPAEKSRV